MERRRVSVLPLIGPLVMMVLTLAAAPAFSEVNVNINVGPPAMVIHEPPEVVVIPRTMVYYAPSVEADLFFYRGYWWTRNGGRWFRSRGYRGPWAAMGPRYVPVEIVRLPPNYRTVYVREERIPHGQLKKHWRNRDLERRQRRGEWKEFKQEQKGRGHGRNG